MLGEFPTQTQAYQATLLSVGEIHPDLFIEDVTEAQQVDLLNVPIASIIAASEEQYKPENNISMHQWTMEMIEQKCHQSTTNEEGGGNNASMACSRSSTAVKRKCKRKGAPRKLDVKTRRFL
jgi:hypothetical protein